MNEDQKMSAERVTVIVDGEAVTGPAGTTLGSLLLAHGRSAWRTTKTKRSRGLFCGIGVCFDCTVTINGAPYIRACRHQIVAGDEVTTHD